MMGDAEKEPAMKERTIWYGASNNEPVFSENKTDLNNRGIDNPQSFTVSGDIKGLNLVSSSHQQTAQSGSQQTA